MAMRNRYPVALVQLRWLSPAEGVKTHRPTARDLALPRLVTEPNQPLDSSVQHRAALDHAAVSEDGQPTNAALTMLYPENLPGGEPLPAR